MSSLQEEILQMEGVSEEVKQIVRESMELNREMEEKFIRIGNKLGVIAALHGIDFDG